MAKARKSNKKAKSKPKIAGAKAPVRALSQVVIEKLHSQPLGKSLSALDSIYKELDDVADRLEILICRIKFSESGLLRSNVVISQLWIRF